MVNQKIWVVPLIKLVTFWPPDLILTALKRKGRALSVFQLQMVTLVKPTFF